MISKNIEQYFAYAHLPEFLQEVSKPFHDMALSIAEKETDKNQHEIDYALRMLLCAKDSTVRAVVAIK